MKKRFPVTVINHLKEVLVEKKLTHSWLAAQIKVHPKLVAAWCANSRQPTVYELWDIRDVLEVPYEDLITFNKEDIGTEFKIINHEKEKAS